MKKQITSKTLNSYFTYKVNNKVFVFISNDKVIEGLVIKQYHIFDRDWYDLKIEDKKYERIKVSFPSYRLGETKEEAIHNSEIFDSELEKSFKL